MAGDGGSKGLSKPTVSVLVPTYNQQSAYLRAALLSAKMQTHPCQIVVVDDGSEPHSHAIFREVVGKEDWHTWHWKPNGGVASALNKALELSTGDYVTWLPSDDLFKPEKTAIQLAAMLAADAAVSYCAYEEGIPMAQNTWPAAQYPTREKLFAMLCQHSFINAATVMWRRDVFEAVGVFDEREELSHTQDTEFILRCAEKFDFLAVNEPLVRRRIHSGQMMNTLKAEEQIAIKRRGIDYMNQRYGASLKVWVPK